MAQYVDKLKDRIPSVGFISSPAWSDPTPFEFTTVVEEQVITQQALLLLPDFDYSLDSIASELVAERLSLCAKSLQTAGCHLVVQVGSPFAWANVASEAQARQRNDRMTKAANIPSVMTTLAIVDALRMHRIKNIAVNCTYYDLSWKKDFSGFLELCGFNVLHSSNLTEQKLVGEEEDVFEYAWKLTPNMVKDSVYAVKKAAPEAEAMVITGTGARTLEILCELEAIAQCPVIPADTVLYWISARYLNLTLNSKMGRFTHLPFSAANG